MVFELTILFPYICQRSSLSELFIFSHIFFSLCQSCDVVDLLLLKSRALSAFLSVVLFFVSAAAVAEATVLHLLAYFP